MLARLFAALLRISGRLTAPLGYRGFWDLAALIGKSAPKRLAYEVPVGTRSRFRFDLSDPYWSRIVCPGYDYEPEVAAILDATKCLSPSFLDCGANFGFWSVVASDPRIGASKVVAIEPARSAFSALAENARINGGRFAILNKAVDTVSGRRVRVEGETPHHACARTRLDPVGQVETIALDDLVRDMPTPCVIKLDVEGAEVAALCGARDALRRDILLIYEDHGADLACEPTAWLLANTDFHVFFMGPEERLTPISSVRQAAALKVKPAKGYNFAAVPPGGSFIGCFDQPP